MKTILKYFVLFSLICLLLCPATADDKKKQPAKPTKARKVAPKPKTRKEVLDMAAGSIHEAEWERNKKSGQLNAIVEEGKSIKDYKPLLGNTKGNAVPAPSNSKSDDSISSLPKGSNLPTDSTRLSNSNAAVTSFSFNPGIVKIENIPDAMPGSDEPIVEYKSGREHQAGEPDVTGIVFRSANGWYPLIYDLLGKQLYEYGYGINPGMESSIIEFKPGDYLIVISRFIGGRNERYKLTIRQGQIAYFTDPRAQRIAIHWDGNNGPEEKFTIYDSNNKYLHGMYIPYNLEQIRDWEISIVPGSYTLKIEGFGYEDIGYQLIPFNVRKGEIVRITPPVGAIHFIPPNNPDYAWTWEVFNASGEKRLLKFGSCPERECLDLKVDIAPGEYLVKAPLARYASKVFVQGGQTTIFSAPQTKSRIKRK